MENERQKRYSTDVLLAEFFAQDDLKALAVDAGALLECPLLVLDDTFHVTAHHRPLGRGRSPMKPVRLSARVMRCLPGKQTM